MCRNNKYKIENSSIHSIYRHAYTGKDFGVCKWNISKNTLIISENITGYKLKSIKSLGEYINIISYDKDKLMALEDLNDYINGIKLIYQSIFRIKTSSGDIKWVLLKGKLIEDRGDSKDKDERESKNKDEPESKSKDERESKNKEECEAKIKDEPEFKYKNNSDCKGDNNKILSVLIINITNNRIYEGYDCLTNLINKKILIKKLSNSIKIAQLFNQNGALIYLNIDNFKILYGNINHTFEDIILKRFSQSIVSVLDNNCELARLEGDEFAILVNDFKDITEISNICNNIRTILDKPFMIADKEIYISVSFGISIFPIDSDDVDNLFTYCDLALYMSKQTGNNTTTYFHKRFIESSYREYLIQNELSNLYLNDEFDIFYQPQIDSATNKVIGIEALLRWNNKKLGYVSPGEFIPIAENNGYIVHIGYWVLEKAIKTACHWKKKGYQFDTISINVSPIQLKRKDFKDNLFAICKKYRVPHDLLEIEITEGTLIELTKEKIEVLNELIESGIHIAIDDFGTGYSSLNYLVSLPISTLKIDKSFIDNIQNEKNQAVISSIVNLSKALKYNIITEGVETREQVEILTKMGCNTIQGYYFSKPLPENAIEEMLMKQS